MKKKFILILVSVILVTCLVFGVIYFINNTSENSVDEGNPPQSVSASDASQSASAQSGDNWTFDAESGKLSIFGNFLFSAKAK